MTTEQGSPAAPDTQKRFFLIWAITATAAAAVFATAALALLLLHRSAPEAAPASPMRADAGPDAAPRPPRARRLPSPDEATPAYPTLGEPLTRPLNASFTNLADSEVAGRYRFFNDSGGVGTITLLPDHGIVNKEGITLRQYRWAIQPDGIMTTWRSSSILFNDMEKPGVYIARRNDGREFSRLEKVQE